MGLPRCWEIRDCGRQKRGPRVDELGECVASKMNVGHCCWAIAGTLCGGEIGGTTAHKLGDCQQCEVYILRHGIAGDENSGTSDSDIDQVAGMLMKNDGEYARICSALRAVGPFAVESEAGRDIWRRVTNAVDDSEARDGAEDRDPDD